MWHEEAFCFGRFKARVHWMVRKAAQRSYITWWWPGLHHGILTDSPFRERRGKILISTGYILQDIKKSNFIQINLCFSDCRVSGQRSAGGQKLHLLAGSPRLHEGHQHPPALPPYQHSTGPLDLQGPERSHRYTQGDALMYNLTQRCPRLLSQLCTSSTCTSCLLTQTHWPPPFDRLIHLCQRSRSVQSSW